jgi:hypothetical protein
MVRLKKQAYRVKNWAGKIIRLDGVDVSRISITEVCITAVNKECLPQDCLQVRHVRLSRAAYIICKLWSKKFLSIR